jgi:HD-GYP domain-containing protein (c-di-GMP phosphodiesterase class II)
MKVIALPASAIRLGVPLPFSLRDDAGRLLLARGSVVETDSARQQLAARGVYVDEAESQPFTRALAGKLDSMVRGNALLGDIANATVDTSAFFEAPDKSRSPDALWPDLVLRASSLLRDAPSAEFSSRLLKLQDDMLDQIERHADASLLILVQNSISDARDYSAKHALLVAVVCELAARHLAHWPEGCRLSLRCAAISMNVAMTALQDQLATQHVAPNPKQREQIDTHAARGVALLTESGVSDKLWLDAVALHHDTHSGPLSAMPPSTQLARLLQRADIFTARLSPREGRKALSATAAAQAAYLDENEQADDAGAAIIKAVGLYPPGTYVRLANGEVALVLRRGRRANEPKVVSIVGREGLPMGAPAVRDSRIAPFNVTGSVAPHEVKVRINIERMTRLV